jgi:Ca2+-binding RTX toxin-like protein
MVAYTVNSFTTSDWNWSASSITLETATRFVYSDTSGTTTVFSGSGFTYDANGLPTGGTISALERYSSYPNGVVLASITGFAAGINDSLTSFLSSANAYAYVFSQSDTITNDSSFGITEVGFAGNDVYNGGSGDDAFFGGAGVDTFYGGAGSDQVEGGAGADVLNGGSHTGNLLDYLSYDTSAAGVNVNLATGAASGGDAQGDTITNFQGVFASAFNDFLTGDATGNGLYGGAGDDVIDGGAGSDYLSGGIGTDTLSYTASTGGVTVNLTNNTATGGDATGDIIIGFENVIGSSGDDVIIGSAAANVLAGGAGSDTISYAFTTSAVNINLNSQTVSGVDAVGDSISGFENAAGGSANDVLLGSTAGNILTGNAGNDFFYAYGGNDTVYGGAGVDVTVAGIGNDIVYGGDETDYIYGDAGTNTLYGDGGVDVIYAQGNSDLLYGGDGGDYLYSFPGAITPIAYGGNGNDIYTDLSGGSSDTFYGDAGQDYFYGLAGDDKFYGGAGVDVFLGGDGNDAFYGGADVDYAWGGAGSDQYYVYSTNGVVVINDFDTSATGDQIFLLNTGLRTYAQVLANSTYYAGLNTTIVTVDSDTAVWLVGINVVNLSSLDFYIV